MSIQILTVTVYYRGLPVCEKCKIFSKDFSGVLSNPMMNCGTNFLNTLYIYWDQAAKGRFVQERVVPGRFGMICTGAIWPDPRS